MSYRARAFAAVQNRAPSEDALRFIPPEYFLPALRSAPKAYSPEAASDGLDFANVLCSKSNLPRPAARWKQSARPPTDPPPKLSERAAGVLGEIATATSLANVVHRPAVFRRNVMSSRLQQWYLGAGAELRNAFAELLTRENVTGEQWPVRPNVNVWPCPLSCQGCKVSREVPDGNPPSQSWSPNPGCPACKRHVVLVIRGVAQLACRLRMVDVARDAQFG